MGAIRDGRTLRLSGAGLLVLALLLAGCAGGLMYARGIGVARDRDEAAAWLRKAADQGYTKAERYLKELGEGRAL